MMGILDVQASVLQAVDRAKLRWPHLECSSVDVIDHVQALGDSCGALAQFGDELCLASACLQGNPVAVRILEQEFISRVGPSLARVSPDKDFADEVLQLLRQRLLLPPDLRLAKYAGTGPLLAWLRVVAMRVGLTLHRTAPPPPTDLKAEHLVDEPCLEGAELRRYHETLDRAVRKAFQDLEQGERNLLRLHYLDGLNLDRLADLFKVHRATIARRLVDLRQRMLRSITRDVRAELRITASEFRSVVRLIGSQLDAHVSALLKNTATDEVRAATLEESKL